MCDEEDIEDSPFMAYIVPDDKDNNPNQVHGIYIIYGRKDATFITFLPKIIIIIMCPRIFVMVFVIIISVIKKCNKKKIL